MILPTALIINAHPPQKLKLIILSASLLLITPSLYNEQVKTAPAGYPDIRPNNMAESGLDLRCISEFDTIKTGRSEGIIIPSQSSIP